MVSRARARAAFVVTCEHGGNGVPAAYRPLLRAHRALLETHRGYDPGALVMARSMAAALEAPLLASTTSRLLVDLNRSIGHPRLHLEVVRNAPAEVRRAVLDRYYRPYRAEAERLVLEAIAGHGRVIHLSSHSFTPVMDGDVRRADIGLLYDPARPGEVALCDRWRASLQERAPGLVVRRNYPYAGKGDGLTAWFRKRHGPRAYVGIELEVNQKHVFQAGRHWTGLRQAIVDSLCTALKPEGGTAR